MRKEKAGWQNIPLVLLRKFNENIQPNKTAAPQIRLSAARM